MDISFYCFKCGQHVVIDEAGAGLSVPCPKCTESLIVPAAITSPAPPSMPLIAPPVISQAVPLAPVCGRRPSKKQMRLLVIGCAIVLLALCGLSGWRVYREINSPERKASEAVEKYETCLDNDYTDPITFRHGYQLMVIRDSNGGGFFETTQVLGQEAHRYNQERADSFIGISEQEVVRRLGKPYAVRTEAPSETVSYKMLRYDSSSERATFFVIFDQDDVFGIYGKKGVVSVGCYRGVWFGPGKEFFQSLQRD
jgi:hypothetical protein